MKKVMRKMVTALLAALLACMACTCFAQRSDVIVFAAASMTEALSEIAPVFEAKHPDVELVFSFDSSGTLKMQIEQGAACDVFISAGQKQMDQLDISADPEFNPDGLDCIMPDTRVDLLENKVVLVVPQGNSKEIDGFDTLCALLNDGDVLMAMGNSDVPVGQYTQRILSYYGLDEKELAKSGVLTYGTNVKEVVTQVSEESVDCGVVYSTDALSAGLSVVDAATREMCGRVIYPAAITKNAQQSELAQEFLSFLLTQEAMNVFESTGFSAVN